MPLLRQQNKFCGSESCHRVWSKQLQYLKVDGLTQQLAVPGVSLHYSELSLLFTKKYTYLLTPRSRILLEKLTGSAASQEIPRIFGTRRFITVFTSARHLSLSWANSIQSSQPTPTSWRSILILSSHLRLGHPNALHIYYKEYVSNKTACVSIYGKPQFLE